MKIKIEKLLKFSWLIAFPLILTSNVKAGEWSVDASINQDFSYDDNVRMREASEDGTVIEEASLIYNVSPVVNFAHRTEVSELSANASYGIERFFDISDLNRDRQKYGVDGHYNMDRLVWGLSSTYSIAPGRDTAETESGDFATDTEKTTFSISPSVSYQLSEQDSLMLSGGYTDASYTEGNQSDYENMNVRLSWTKFWSERFNSSLDFAYSEFDSSNNSPDNQESINSDSYEINLSSTYLLSEIWQLYGKVGGRITETEDNIRQTKDDSAGFLLDLGTTYTGESLSADFNISRSLAPTSRGRLDEQSRVSLDVSYLITERLSTALFTSYQESESVDRDNDPTKRTNFTVSPSLSWRLNPDWTLSTSYRYRYQERPVNNKEETSDSNLYMISLNYRWQGLSISR